MVCDEERSHAVLSRSARALERRWLDARHVGLIPKMSKGTKTHERQQRPVIGFGKDQRDTRIPGLNENGRRCDAQQGDGRNGHA